MSAVADAPPPSAPSVDLWWLPVGAGGRVVVRTSRWWEILRARREHRPPSPLFHAALDLHVGGRRLVVEMTPTWGQPAAARGVVVTGPVGARALGRLPFFRYVVRAWTDGILPDHAFAVAPPTAIPLTRASAEALLRALPEVPALTWGRTAPGTGDMWNSNSVIAWLLTRAGVDAAALAPPAPGRAPGWTAGIAVARRDEADLS